MSFEFPALIILIVSFIGMFLIIFRKIPVLLRLPEAIQEPPKDNFLLKLKEKIKNTPTFQSFSTGVFLQKILSKIRILSLKADNKTAGWLQRLRERAQKKKIEKSDNYWEELKKSTKKK